MAQAKKPTPKEFDGGYFINPFLCKTKLRAKLVPDGDEIELTFKGIKLGKHKGGKK